MPAVAGRCRPRSPAALWELLPALAVWGLETAWETALSEGSMTTLLAAGATEAEVGLDRLREVAATVPTPVPWWISYQAVLALA